MTDPARPNPYFADYRQSKLLEVAASWLDSGAATRLAARHLQRLPSGAAYSLTPGGGAGPVIINITTPTGNARDIVNAFRNGFRGTNNLHQVGFD
jgi:hypothetical protein